MLLPAINSVILKLDVRHSTDSPTSSLLLVVDRCPLPTAGVLDFLISTMSITSLSSSKSPNGDRGCIAAKLPEQNHRRSHRLALPNRKSSHDVKGSITHINIFLGSPTAVSELLVSSLIEKAEENGAVISLKSLDNLNPDRLTGTKSPYCLPNRLTVFVLSTHMAGKPSPNAERFLQWLQQATPLGQSATIDSLQSEELQVSDVAAIFEPGAPGNTSLKVDGFNTRKHRVISISQNVETQPRASVHAIQPNFRISWRCPFGGGANTTSTATKPLQDLHFAVFGIGNSTYRTYNCTAKYVDARLQELGGVRVCQLGLGDISKDIDSTFAEWEAQLLQLMSDQPSKTGVSVPVRAIDTLTSVHRASLPNSISNGAISSVGLLTRQTTIIRGPTAMDVAGSFAGISEKPKEDTRQRRYSSAMKLLRKQHPSRDSSPSVTCMPSLSGHR